MKELKEISYGDLSDEIAKIDVLSDDAEDRIKECLKDYIDPIERKLFIKKENDEYFVWFSTKEEVKFVLSPTGIGFHFGL